MRAQTKETVDEQTATVVWLINNCERCVYVYARICMFMELLSNQFSFNL